MEHTIGIRELKSRISEVIKAVSMGESTIITYHGKPMARIVPYQPPAAQYWDALKQSPSIDWDGTMIREIHTTGYNTSHTQISDVVSDQRE